MISTCVRVLVALQFVYVVFGINPQLCPAALASYAGCTSVEVPLNHKDPSRSSTIRILYVLINPKNITSISTQVPVVLINGGSGNAWFFELEGDFPGRTEARYFFSASCC